MAELQQYKELEKKVHEQLYNNLYLLSRWYPTSPDFKRIFKKDMFLKNNKAAFYQVVYYLLEILNPQLTKEKLTSWPPYEIKLENKFRSELLRYINELNNLYGNADIPPIMSSQLISPGGYRFTKFIFKLSQLVLNEHLKKSNSSVLCTLKRSKNTNITRASISSVKTQVANIECDTRLRLDNFNSVQGELRVKAVSIVENSSDLEQKTVDAKKKLLQTKEESTRRYPEYPSLDSLREKILALQKQWGLLQNIHKLFVEAETLLSYLKGDSFVLEYKEDFKFPAEIASGISSTDLDLADMFHGIELILQRKSLELPNPTTAFINKSIEEMQKLNNTILHREKEIVERKSQTESLLYNFQQSLKYINDLIIMSQKSNKQTIDFSDDLDELENV